MKDSFMSSLISSLVSSIVNAIPVHSQWPPPTPNNFTNVSMKPTGFFKSLNLLNQITFKQPYKFPLPSLSCPIPSPTTTHNPISLTTLLLGLTTISEMTSTKFNYTSSTMQSMQQILSNFLNSPKLFNNSSN